MRELAEFIPPIPNIFTSTSAARPLVRRKASDVEALAIDDPEGSVDLACGCLFWNLVDVGKGHSLAGRRRFETKPVSCWQPWRNAGACFPLSPPWSAQPELW